LTRLRQLSINCDFTENDREIKSQIIQGCSSSRLRRRALREDQNLDELLKLARSMELSDKQACEIEHTEKSQSANAVRAFKNKSGTNRKKNFRKSSDAKIHFKRQTCRNCGGEYPHVERQCPAKGKSCHACKKQNHFSSVCRSKTKMKPKVNSVNKVDESSCDTSDSNDDYMFGIQEQENVNSVKSKQPSLNVTINGLNVRMLVDTGSSINVLDENTYKKFQVKPKLSKTDTKVFTYGSNTNFPLLGKFIGTLETAHRITTATIYVTKGDSGCLLCYDSAVELQVIPAIAMFTSSSSKAEQLCQKYSSIFDGIGKLKDVEIDLHIDPNIQPVQQPHRRIPFHVRKDVEKELKIMMENDLIEEVDGGATPWVSPIVVAPKPKSPNEVRICVDMREPNRAIKRTRYLIPTVDDIIVDLNGAKVFSKLDLVKGYNQLILSERSRNITCFTTHAGLFRYKRLCFGINSAAEI
ncbi:MAG: aspartyl protease family protein, partial [Candidatus Thiodiazotropha endolucinida]|nr:aspartyl protease family protein [Candidatus Thiodiazotropha taylori]MCW4344467.1 aspartyl protease family protein [Candidatus Thiodiazotropha endolucinida]